MSAEFSAMARYASSAACISAAFTFLRRSDVKRRILEPSLSKSSIAVDLNLKLAPLSSFRLPVDLNLKHS